MSKNKVIKIYNNLTLKDKIKMLDLLLWNNSLFIFSDKRKVGFTFHNPIPYDHIKTTENGTQAQININLDELELCSADKNVKLPKNWNKVKLNTFVIPSERKLRCH